MPPNNSDIANMTDVKVTFFPPLYIERQGWILDVLRRESVTSLLDVGCAEGSLLRCLCNPTPFLLSTEHDGNARLNGRREKDEKRPSPTHVEPTLLDSKRELHIRKLAGLDVCKTSLESCINLMPQTKDCDVNGESSYVSRSRPNRWESLDVKLWFGSLNVYNPEFVGVECITASEVIEHLPDSVLSTFAPVLLGLYRPRLLLITTPSYTFNARFSAPEPVVYGKNKRKGKKQRQQSRTIRDGGCLDPTGRTTRVFRHTDHKFEWTVDEFTAWCLKVANDWDYSVDVSGIGLPMEKDPWGRDQELGTATQVAIFRRLDEASGGKRREARSCAIGLNGVHACEQADRDQCPHELLKSLHYAPHIQTKKVQSKETIQTLVSNTMQSCYFEEGYTVWDLWVSEEVAAACGGYLDVFVRALEDAAPSQFELERVSEDVTKSVVKFSGERHRRILEQSRSRKMLRIENLVDQDWERKSLDAPVIDTKDWHNELSTDWPIGSLDELNQDSVLTAHSMAWNSWDHEDSWASESTSWKYSTWTNV